MTSESQAQPATPWQLYPTLFGDPANLGCGEGWYPLLNQMCECLMVVEKSVPIKVTISTVKEKLGTARIYYSTEWLSETAEASQLAWEEVVASILHRAERTSAFTCEESGQYGTLRTLTGWHRTLCDAEYEKHVRARENVSVATLEERAVGQLAKKGILGDWLINQCRGNEPFAAKVIARLIEDAKGGKS